MGVRMAVLWIAAFVILYGCGGAGKKIVENIQPDPALDSETAFAIISRIVPTLAPGGMTISETGMTCTGSRVYCPYIAGILYPCQTIRTGEGSFDFGDVLRISVHKTENYFLSVETFQGRKIPCGSVTGPDAVQILNKLGTAILSYSRSLYQNGSEQPDSGPGL